MALRFVAECLTCLWVWLCCFRAAMQAGRRSCTTVEGAMGTNARRDSVAECFLVWWTAPTRAARSPRMNIPIVTVEALRRIGRDVRDVRETPEESIPDQLLWDSAQREVNASSDSVSTGKRAVP